MARRPVTVAQLAHEAGLDLDEAIVTLWDAGIEHVSEPSHQIPAGSIPKARRAFGLVTAREISSPSHWKSVLRLDDDGWQILLADLNLSMSSSARRLPKGAIAKLRRYAAGKDVRTSANLSRVQKVSRGRSSTAPPLVWKNVGKVCEVSSLTAEDINRIHEVLVEEFAKSEDPFGDPNGVRDWNLLESSAFRQETTFGSDRKYPSAEMTAAALLHSVIHNHPFYNGNKRTAFVAMMVLLDAHDLTLTCHEDELFRYVLRVSQHNLVGKDLDQRPDREVQKIAEWIKQNSRKLLHGDRPIKWYKLRQILNGYECQLEQASGVGNRMNIVRIVSQRGIFGIRRSVELKTQVAYGDEGREVDRDTLKKIRNDLDLNEANGVDSAAFYGEASTPRDFIFRYSRTLKRLARL